MVFRRVRPRRAARAGRPPPAFHRRRYRSAACRRDDTDSRGRDSTARHCPRVRRRGARPEVPTESVEVAGFAVPPLRSAGVCSWDYRCLTTIRPEQVPRRRLAGVDWPAFAPCGLRSAFAPSTIRRGRRMNTTTGQDRPAGLERVACFALLAFAASLQVSIFAAGVLLHAHRDPLARPGHPQSRVDRGAGHVLAGSPLRRWSP